MIIVFDGERGIMNEVKDILVLKDSKIKILKVSELVVDNEKIKVITIVGTTKKVKCPICKKDISNIHDKFKAMRIKYLKMAKQKNRNYTDKKKIYLLQL